jgi:hypothetical protein
MSRCQNSNFSMKTVDDASLNVRQLADKLGISPASCRRWARSGLLPPPKIVTPPRGGLCWVWPAGTRPLPDTRLAPTVAPRLVAIERLGVRLSLIQGRVFDLIREAGQVGVSARELHSEIYGQHSRPRGRDAIVQVIRKINRRLAGTPWRIIASWPRKFARYRLHGSEHTVLTSHPVDRGRKMPGARQRFYDDLPIDVRKQEQLERENRQLRAEVQALRSVVSTTHRLAAPYVSKPEPTSRMLTKAYTSNK